jgi:hypothetical protein
MKSGFLFAHCIDWLLDIDGISSQWKDGLLVSDWDGVLGQMDINGLHESIPNSIVQLSSILDPHNYNLSNMGPGEDVVGEIYHCDSGEEEEIELGQMTPVNSLSLVFILRLCSLAI